MAVAAVTRLVYDFSEGSKDLRELLGGAAGHLGGAAAQAAV